jgi:hypothetical protein
MNGTPDQLDVSIIRRAWSRETSASPDEWTPWNRSRGQCAITAVIVQDCIGGKLIRTVATKPDGTEESHYANLLDNGVEYDLTASQFPEGTEFGPWEERTREYVLGYPATKARYFALVRRLNECRTLDTIRSAQ